MKKIIIVGGVAGGASTAARLRRLDETAEIIIIEKSNYVSYANCGLPYYIGNVIENEQRLLVQTPESLYKRFNIDVRVSSEVTKVDTTNKTVTIINNGKSYTENYDYLVLAPGSKARKLYDNEDKLLHLKNVEDVQMVKKQLDNAHKIAVIGGGFIGIELAENLRHINKDVTIFEYADHIMPNLDNDIVYYLEKEIRDHNINLLTGARIKNIDISDGYTITLNDETSLNYDLVVVAAGVAPNTEFIKDSGITLDNRGFIEVNEYMQTNIDNIYACGDATISKHFITGLKENVALAGPANKQGRIIADNIAGLKSKYDGSIGTSIIKVFNMNAGSSGLNTARLTRDNYHYDVINIHPFSHATYYPNAQQIHAKLFYDIDTLKILGVQAAGIEGVDKLIDVIATAIKLNAKVTDLVNLELAYAPPFLSAKSPANYFGFIAENIVNNLEETITPEKLKEDDIILDVRYDEEYNNGHVENTLHIPVDKLRKNIHLLDQYKDQTINVLCAVGLRAHVACRILTAHGFKARNITGGYISYTTK